MTTARTKARILGAEHESPTATVVRSSKAPPVPSAQRAQPALDPAVGQRAAAPQCVEVGNHRLDLLIVQRHGLAEVGGSRLQALHSLGAGPAQWHKQAHHLAVACDGDRRVGVDVANPCLRAF